MIASVLLTAILALLVSLPTSTLAQEVVVVEDSATLGAEATPAPETQETSADGQTSEEPKAAEEDKKKEQEKKEPPPPRTFNVLYDPNGGTGAMEPSTFTEGQPAPLTRCTYTRSGYTFEGWATAPDGSGTHYVDGSDIAADLSADTTILYAQWGSQIYLIRYATGVAQGSGSPVTGTMHTQFAVHDAQVSLRECEFERVGYVATGWMDSQGVFRDFGDVGVNFAEGTTTTSWEVADVSMELVRPGTPDRWSCQGSVVFKGDDGNPWAAVAFIKYDDNYRVGSLDTYDSEIVVVNLTTGELMKHASGLMLEHANDIAYNPDNGHFYVAQGGLHDNFPDGIVELDENLHEVRTLTPAGTHHIWNLTYADGFFYAIGNVDGDSFARGNPTGDTSDLITLDADLNVLDMRAIDFSSQGFSGQGMACDGDELYAILVNFAEADAANKQRLSLFTLAGDARGTQYIDIPQEVESASWLDGRMYFSVNGGTSSTLYGTDLASTTMSVVWKPNTYQVLFDANGAKTLTMPETINTQYDQEFSLSDVVPVSPGYVFRSWNTEPDGSGDAYLPGESVRNLVISGSITLYAQWERPGVAFVADSGTRTSGRRFREQARAQVRARHAKREADLGEAEGLDDMTTDSPGDVRDLASSMVLAILAIGRASKMPRVRTRRPSLQVLAPA